MIKKGKQLFTKNNIQQLIKDCIVVAIVFVFFNYIIMIGTEKSNSMAPTLVTHDIIISNRLAYKVCEPESGDIISFKFTKDGNTKIYCKRVVAVEGDTVEFKNEAIYVNGNKLDETSYLPEGTINEPGNQVLYEVPENCVFVLGDARRISYDSRYWENPYVSYDDILSKMMFRIPLGKRRQFNY